MVFFKQLNKYGIIASYLFFSIITDLFLSPFLEIKYGSPFLGSRIFTVAEYFFLSVFLYNWTSFKNKKVLYFSLSAIFISAVILENIKTNNVNFDSYSVGVSGVLILTYCIILLFEKLNNSNSLNIIDSKFVIIILK